MFAVLCSTCPFIIVSVFYTDSLVTVYMLKLLSLDNSQFV